MIENKPYLFIVLVCCLFLGNGFTAQGQTYQQNTFALKQMLPTSPEAALLGRFGDIPVGTYTGTASVTIPLYTIKIDGLDIPVSLNYQSSGIKVEDLASNVGLGWLLEPGGAIIQITNGIEDAADDFVSSSPTDYAFLKAHNAVTGYHGARNQIGYDACLCHGVVGDGDSYHSMQSLLQGYLQPDIFQYNFPGGYSGKFYINPENNQPVLIDKKDQLNFTKITGGWMVSTLNGTKYYFSAMEQVSDGTSWHNGYTWKLSRIITSGGKIVDFSYTTSSFTNTTYSETFHSSYPLGNGSPSDYDPPLETADGMIVQHPGALQNTVQTISQISSRDVVIKFNQTTRQDLTTPAIQSIDILDAVTGVKLKTFTLNYSYFGYNTTGGSYTLRPADLPFTSQATLDKLGMRLKLLSVQENGYVNGTPVPLPPYNLTYNENYTLPMRTSYARDYWGYYNGLNNTTLAPDLNYFYINNQTPGSLPYYMLTAYKVSNRAVDTSKISTGMLYKIKYPTGGTSAFDYESNSFANYDYPDVNKLQNSNLQTNIYIQDKNNPVISNSATFTLPHKVTLPITIFFGKGVPQNSVTFSDMLNAYVVLNKISGGVTTQLRKWVLTTDRRTDFDNGGVTITDSYDFPDDAVAQYQVIASIPDQLGNQDEAMKNASASCTITNIPQAPVTGTKLSYGGGVRVAAIRNYDNTGLLTDKKVYKYVNDNQTSSGLLMSPLQLVYDRMMHFEYLRHTNPDPASHPDEISVSKADADIWWVTSESQTPFSYAAGGNIIGYSRVEEIQQGTGTATNGKTITYYNNTPSETGYNTPDNPDLLNGKIAKQQVFDASNNKLVETTYNYTNLFNFTFTAFKAMYNVVLNYACEPFTIKSPTYPPYSYLILEYPINSKWYLLSNKIETKYFNGVAHTATENYTYNTYGQVATQSYTNSRGEVMSSTFKWPVDIPAASRTPIQQSLVDSGFYESVLEQHILDNQSEIGQVKVSYALLNGRLVRSQIDKSFNGGALFTDAIFDAYGTNKNIQQVREKGIIPTALIWDDKNTNVIAEVKNAQFSESAYTSFEPGQTGNWAISSTARDNSASFTGTFSYNLANGALTRSGLIAANTYIVTYWTKNTTPLTISGTKAGYPLKKQSVNGWNYYEHSITGVTGITISGVGNIDEVRLRPEMSLMTTYTFDPLTGMKSSTAPKGQTTFYEYDGLQRLKDVKNNDGNVVKHLDYHYQGQN